MLSESSTQKPLHSFGNAIEVFPPMPEHILGSFSEQSRKCLERLSAHRRIPPLIDDIPVTRLAAVLVLLYEKNGHIRVLLTTRDKSLRTHAGQTALPGGRCDETDFDIVSTAYREASEEVHLPLSSPDVHTIALLEPFISLYGLVVTPVIAVLGNLSVLNHLVAADGEVSRIFDHPLEALLDPELLRSEALVERGEDWPYPEELHNTTDSYVEQLHNTAYRMHRFRSNASPVKGLTADILIKVAEIAYGKGPTYERYHTQQLRGFGALKGLLPNYGGTSQNVSKQIVN